VSEHTPKPRFGLEQETAARLCPQLWNRDNLLFVPMESLSDVLRELCRSLPLEARPPAGARFSGEAYDDELHGQADADDAPAEVAFLLSSSRELAAVAEAEGSRLADAGLWCELLGPGGWLNASVADAAGAFGVREEVFLRALAIAQEAAEPAGLFARDAAECLLLQLDAAGGRDCDAGTLLTEGRNALESGERALADFARGAGWSDARLRDALRALRRLDPAPGRGVCGARFIRPELDFYTARNERGERLTRCRLARENLPRLSLASEDLLATVEKKDWTRAKALLTRLGLRYRALLRVGVFFAERQAEYLSGAAKYKSPAGLKDAAAASGLHVSTVSRILAGTWARSPRGTLRLSSLLSRSHGAISYGELEAVLRAASERGESDAAVARETGIPRRTVAYQRRRLGIPASRV